MNEMSKYRNNLTIFVVLPGLALHDVDEAVFDGLQDRADKVRCERIFVL